MVATLDSQGVSLGDIGTEDTAAGMSRYECFVQEDSRCVLRYESVGDCNHSEDCRRSHTDGENLGVRTCRFRGKLDSGPRLR